MMWLLTSLDTGESYCLSPVNEKYTIGRSNTDIILKNDSSISREHACLYPSYDSIEIIDNNSKYGTFINSETNKNLIDKNKRISLNPNDSIKFGIFTNDWVLKKLTINCLSSTLNSTEKFDLKNNINYLNGKIIEKINIHHNIVFTHLTMEKITVTSKFLYALIEEIPIINSNYWNDFREAIVTKNVIPNHKNYLPVITEKFINLNQDLLKPNKKRKELFDGKTFYFSNNMHINDYFPIITKCGGKLETLNKHTQTSLLLQPNSIVVHNSTFAQSQTQIYNNLGDYLKKFSIRLVPDLEIGLAVLYCSIEKYCNPKFVQIKKILKPSNPNILTSSKIIVEETPQMSQDEMIEDDNCIEIPDSDLAQNSIQILPTEDITDLPCTSSNDIQLHVDISDNPLESNNVLESIMNSNESINHSNDESLSNSSEELLHEKKLLNSNKNQKRKLSANLELPEPPKKRINHNEFNGFLSKNLISQLVPANAELNDSQNSIVIENSKKRKRFISTLNSDDDDDNLFNFGGSKKCKSQPKSNKENKNEGFFGFIKETNLDESAKLNIKLVSQPINNKIEKKSNTKIHRTCSPINLRNITWLSKSFIKLDLTKIDEEDENKFNEEQKKYVESIKNGFEVQIRPMNLISKSTNDFNANETDFTDSSSVNGRNFKAFIKKQNYQTQKQIINTVPVHISGYEF